MGAWKQKIVSPNYTLYLGDCLDILPLLKEEMDTVTDPPYGIGESSAKAATRTNAAAGRDYGDGFWDKRQPDAVKLAVEMSKNSVVYGGNYYSDVLPISSGWIVWDKQNTGDFADCELAWTSKNCAIRKISYLWNGMIKKKPEKRYHLTQKPLEVMTWTIRNYTELPLILDPFMGSGTTAVAASQLGKRFIGIEISEKYFNIAAKRIEYAYAQKVMPF